MPSLGFDMTEGKVSRWIKQEGDAVKKGEVIGEIETEKATVELEAASAGVLKKILISAGETVPVNTTIAIIGSADEKLDTPTKSESKTKTIAPSAQTASVAQAPVVEVKDDGRIKASPVARNMANEAGIDLTLLKGTGPGGRITERDVRAEIDARVKQVPAPQAIPAQTVVPPIATSAVPAMAPSLLGGEVALSKMRQTIAQRMTQSKTTVPHFYVTIEINMSEAMKLREQLNAMATDVEKVSVNDLIVSATARTLRKFPTLNASFRGDKLEIHSDINLGIAVSVEEGLLTPTLRDADKKTLKEIAIETKGMSERARVNKLRPGDLMQSTFTISNLGMFGVDEFSAIINPPEAAILAIGAVSKQAIVVDEQIKIAQMMRATISADHRVTDGAHAALFMQELKKMLENPVNLLLT